MKKIILLNIVGLTKGQFEKIKPKNLWDKFANNFTSFRPCFPAVTCSVQTSLLSGVYPSEHGIIANGYFDNQRNQVSFWEQPAGLVEKPRIWDILKKEKPSISTAILFWQNSMYANSDVIITPKPIHLHNKIIMWCYSKPVGFYEKVSEELGEFKLKSYWGPFASIESSQWIIESAKKTIQNQSPGLVLVYLPHLDYAAQKFGPESPEFTASLMDLDDLIGEFFSFLENHKPDEYEIILVSEYGFNEVNNSISPNRILRDNNLLSVRKISGKEYIDFELSKAFAMVDHQIAHVYIKPGFKDDVTRVFSSNDVGTILDDKLKIIHRIDNTKSGDIILCAKKDSWFNYYWWNDVSFAPEFTFTVDIHRKPGYDPLELFIDPKSKTISHDTSLIKGSHGVIDEKEDNHPLLASTIPFQSKSDIDVTFIAPSILKLFNVSYNPEKSFF